LKKWLARRLFRVVAVIAFIALPGLCRSQVLPDTTNNHTRVNFSELDKDTTNTPKAQVSTPPASTDTISADSLKRLPFQPDPKKAGMYSAILPGLGQLYNKQYWKIPVVYGAFGVATYFIITNLKNYQSYYKAYIGRINNPYPSDQYVNIYSESQLQQLETDYSKYLDLTVLFTGIGFAVQVIDAVTSAHLKNFDISRDISMKVKPVIYPTGAGVGILMSFK
jgi:hypothetical protein